MPDPVTSIGLGAIAAYVTKDAVTRLLGPPADYLGGELAQFTERRMRTVGRILQNATEKAGARLDEPGAVPPRVLRDVVNDASLNEDAVSVEYFGGVLASARTPTSRDDRAAVLTSLLSRLSTYQMRSHYIFYSAIRAVHKGAQHNIATDQGRTQLRTILRLDAYVRLLDPSKEELEVLDAIVQHTLWGLAREDLIDSDFMLGGKFGPKNDRFEGMYFQPTALGAELLLCAHGLRYRRVNEMLDQDLRLNMRSLHDLEIRSGDAFGT
jgi:hypothetical protein